MAAWPFVDVGPGHWAYNSIKWLCDNKITTGYPDNTYHPDNNVKRDEMAAFLHRQAGAWVAAGVHIEPKSGGGFEVTDWFNNVNGQKPIHTWFLAHGINFGFPTENRFPLCVVDGQDSVTSLCSVQVGGNLVLVSVYDVKNDSLFEPTGFWLLVFGLDIQP